MADVYNIKEWKKRVEDPMLKRTRAFVSRLLNADIVINTSWVANKVVASVQWKAGEGKAARIYHCTSPGSTHAEALAELPRAIQVAASNMAQAGWPVDCKIESLSFEDAFPR